MSANPHIRAGNSPLDALIGMALTRFGEFAPSTIDGDLSQMMLSFANEVLDEMHEHPYWGSLELPEVESYVSIHDARPIEDTIMIHGLVAKYAIQQKSNSAEIHWPAYQRRLTSRLWHRLSGGGQIQLRPYAKAKDTNKITGMPEEKG